MKGQIIKPDGTEVRTKVSRKDAAAFLGISIQTLDRRMRLDEDLDYFKIGSRIVFDCNDLRRYLERRRVKCGADQD